MDPFIKALLISILIYLMVGVIVAIGYAMSERTKYLLIGYILTILLWPVGVYDEYRRKR